MAAVTDPKVESYPVTEDGAAVSASVTRDASAALLRAHSMPFGQVKDDGGYESFPGQMEAILAAAVMPRSMKTTPRWLGLYFDTAARHAQMSKDTTQVGACLVGLDGEVRMAAFNGPPRGVADLPERRERPEKYLFASHAEQNLVAFCAREGIAMKGCAVFVTHSPCSACARSLIQAGIAAVYFDSGTTNMPWAEFAAAEAMFKEAGVALVKRQGTA